MHRASSIFGSAIFLVAAPGTVAVYAPWAISHWHLTPPLLGWFPLRVIGVFMIAAGTPVLLDSFVRFARSEEHTSELQSQSNLVCRLLLEKKTICYCAWLPRLFALSFSTPSPSTNVLLRFNSSTATSPAARSSLCVDPLPYDRCAPGQHPL